MCTLSRGNTDIIDLHIQRSGWVYNNTWGRCCCFVAIVALCGTPERPTERRRGLIWAWAVCLSIGAFVVTISQTHVSKVFTTVSTHLATPNPTLAPGAASPRGPSLATGKDAGRGTVSTTSELKCWCGPCNFGESVDLCHTRG